MGGSQIDTARQLAIHVEQAKKMTTIRGKRSGRIMTLQVPLRLEIHFLIVPPSSISATTCLWQTMRYLLLVPALSTNSQNEAAVVFPLLLFFAFMLPCSLEP